MNIWHIYDYAAFFIRIQKSEQAQLFLKYSYDFIHKKFKVFVNYSHMLKRIQALFVYYYLYCV